MREYGRVYKSLQDTSVLRVIVFAGPAHTIMYTVLQDNAQAAEFTIDAVAGDYHAAGQDFDTKWEAFGDIKMVAEADALLESLK